MNRYPAVFDPPSDLAALDDCDDSAAVFWLSLIDFISVYPYVIQFDSLNELLLLLDRTDFVLQSKLMVHWSMVEYKWTINILS